MGKTKTPIWAVVRLDGGRDAPLAPDRVTVQAIWWSADDARKEAARLNELNGDKEAEYFAQVTRLVEVDDRLEGGSEASSAP